MKILICGSDGYLGFTLMQYLSKRGHEVFGLDNMNRRKWVEEVGGKSITPIQSMGERQAELPTNANMYKMDITDYDNLEIVFKNLFPEPDCIVHLAEMPSAPYSLIDAKHAVYTHNNNLGGTLNLLFLMRDYCPNAHLLKLGTLGEYGTPNTDIPEGRFDLEFRGRVEKNAMFPRKPGSFYHATKCHDTTNIEMATRFWGLKATDIHQGVVYGVEVKELKQDEKLLTRFDIDECFGTAINRFVASAIIDEPITLYGPGHQKRGFLPLCDSMQCFTLAIENPPEEGEYRSFNQLEEVYNVTELAEMVKEVAVGFNIDAKIKNYTNPRVELEDHYYNPDHQKLLDLGYEPITDMKQQLRQLFNRLLDYKDRIEEVRDVIIPKIKWNGEKRKSELI